MRVGGAALRVRDGRVPRLVVDGKSYTWDEIGRMLMTFEVLQLKMEVYDDSEDR